MRRLFWLSLVGMFSLLGGLAESSGAADRAAAARPNVLFLFTDDQRADTIGALGNPHIKTPTLDSLAKSGFVFNNAYCLGANQGAVCTPSRNMLLSGRAYFRWKGNFASGDDPNFPVSMKQAGYLTYHHGKRGNSALEIQAKFEHNLYINESEERVSGQPGKSIVDAAIDFLRTHRDERPIFMYLAFESPHDPRVAAKEYLDLYDRWKLIRYPHINKTQLFDLRKDPHELRNLADNPSQASRIVRMMSALKEWQKKLGDTAPVSWENPQDPIFTPPTANELAKLRERLKM